MRNKIALLMLVCSFLFVLPVMAQENDPEPTDQPATYEEIQALINDGELTEAEIEALIEQLENVQPLLPTPTPVPPTATPAPRAEVQATIVDEAAAAIIELGTTQEATSETTTEEEDSDTSIGFGLFFVLLGLGAPFAIIMFTRQSNA
jgi:ribosomal protein L12E/L44/L45/RPP1/RPP2